MAAPSLQVLSIGQCGADHMGITHLLRSLNARAVQAATVDEALKLITAQSFALILVNRIFDLDGASGIECIKTLKARPELASVPIMLVSNYEDSQREAVESGALPGFGKSSLMSGQTKERIQAALSGGK